MNNSHTTRTDSIDLDDIDTVDVVEAEPAVASAADLANVDLAELEGDAVFNASLETIGNLEGLSFEDYDFTSIVADMNLFDVTGSLATLEAYRAPFVAAARRAGRKNPAAEFYNVTNTPLFNRRIELRAEVKNLEATEDLSVGEEIDLRRAKGELETLTELIVRLNYGLTRNYVKQFTSNTSAEDSADFQGAANVGLMVAIDSFDPSKGKFGAWAFKPVQRSVLRAVREADYKNLNEGDFEKRPKVLRAFNELVEERGEGAPTPTHEEVAERAGVHHGLVKRVIAAPHLSSIHTPVGDTGNTELGDLIPDADSDFEEQVLTGMSIERLVTLALPSLSKKEFYVLSRVVGLDGEAPDALSDIGHQLGLSREAVRQIRGKAFAKLLHPITLRKLVTGKA